MTPAAERLTALVAQAEDGLLWLARRRVAAGDTPLERARALADLAPLVAAAGPLVAAGYVKDFAKVFQVPPGLVRDAFAAAAPGGEAPTSPAGLPKGGAGNSPMLDAGCSMPEAGGGAGSLAASLAAFDARHFKTWFGSASYVGRETTDEEGRETVQFVTAGDLTRYYSHVRVPVFAPKHDRYELKELAKEWLDWPSVRTYERVAFRPDGAVPPGTYNLWRGLAVVPAAGSCALYWAHVRHVCGGDPELVLYVRRWLAHAVQRTAELPEVALVLRGLQGTGKGWLVRPLLEIFGSHALTVHSMEHVSGRFNAHLKDVVLLFADEAFWGGDKSREGLIKSLITERKRLVEPKNKDAQQVDAYTRLIVATNTDWPLAMDHDDRRMVVIDVPDDHKEDRAYFGALAAELANGGTAALLAELLAEDLTGWHPRLRPARRGGFDIKLKSSSAVAQWWHECLVSETNQSRHHTGDGGETAWWADCPPVDDLHGGYRRWCERLGRKYIESRESWAREFRRLVPHLGVHRPTGGTRARCYKVGTVAECRAAFERHYQTDAELWADPPGRDQEEYRGEF